VKLSPTSLISTSLGPSVLLTLFSNILTCVFCLFVRNLVSHLQKATPQSVVITYKYVFMYRA
jgi:hypothetical protein